MKSIILAVLAVVGAAQAQTGTGALSTSTIYAPTTITISSCAPTVTNCPYATKPTVITSWVPVGSTVVCAACAKTPVGTGVVTATKTAPLTVYTGAADAKAVGGVLMAAGLVAAML